MVLVEVVLIVVVLFVMIVEVDIRYRAGEVMGFRAGGQFNLEA